MAQGILLQTASDLKQFHEWKGDQGGAHVVLYDVAGAPLLTAGNPGQVVLAGSNVTDGKTLGAGDVGGANMLYTGAAWDRQRNNTEGTLLASAARTATADAPNQVNYNARGVVVYVNVTVAGTGGLTTIIKGIDPVSGQTVQLNTAAVQITGIGIYAVALYPGASAAPTGTVATGQVVNRVATELPRTWKVTIIPADASSWTYSVGYGMTV